MSLNKNEIVRFIKNNELNNFKNYLIDNPRLASTFFNKEKLLVHYAASHGKIDFLDIIIKYNPNVNAQDIRGNTPLHYAIKNNHLDTVRYLISKNANLDITNINKNTPLHFAIIAENYASVSLLTQHNANINAENKSKIRPLHIAAQRGKIDIVRYLINNKSDINAKDADNNLPIHMAVKENNYDTLLFLIANGSKLTEKNSFDDTIIDLATKSYNTINKQMFKVILSTIIYSNNYSFREFKNFMNKQGKSVKKFLEKTNAASIEVLYNELVDYKNQKEFEIIFSSPFIKNISSKNSFKKKLKKIIISAAVIFISVLVVLIGVTIYRNRSAIQETLNNTKNHLISLIAKTGFRQNISNTSLLKPNGIEK